MKIIKVVAAIIVKDSKIFATKRGYGQFKGGWEFPGGKVEINESNEEALIREIKEELDSTIKIKEYFDTIEYDYDNFHLSMDCFICELVEGNLVLKEHEDAKWLSVDEIDSVDWLPADIAILDKIKAYLS